MDTPAKSSPTTIRILIFSALLIFLLGHMAGFLVFNNNWSFNHWQFVSTIYLILWVVGSGILFYFLSKDKLLLQLSESQTAHCIVAGILLIVFIILGYDNFLYGGGNHRMNQIAQADTIIYRWYEPLSIFLVGLFFKLFHLFTKTPEAAGFYSWKLFSYVATITTMFFSWKLACSFSQVPIRKLLLFIILFFSPATIIYFGYIGLEPIIPAVVYAFVFLALENIRNFTLRKLFLIWVLFFAGIFFHVSLIILLPAVIYLTFKPLFARSQSTSFALGITTLIILIIVVFKAAHINYEAANEILQIHGPDYSQSYHLFSWQHIGDVFQLVLLAFPLIVLLKAVSWMRLKNLFTRPQSQLILLVTIASNVAVILIDPVHSIILDYPRLAVYLAPASILLAYLLAPEEQCSTGNMKFIALISLAIPFATLPVYTSIYKADPYIADYLDKNPQYYFEGSTSLTNSYFFLGDKVTADKWFVALPKNSPDFLDYTAATELTSAEEYAIAIQKLNNLKAKYPFWVEPRQLLATIHMNQKHYRLAKPVIDSCLLLEPYDYQSRALLYRYYRDMNDFDNAVKTINQTIQLFPHDKIIKEDKLIAHYRHGDLRIADSLSRELLVIDSTLPFPYLIRGFIAEYTHDTTQAIYFFEQFIKHGPDEAEVPNIRKRLNDLVNATRK